MAIDPLRPSQRPTVLTDAIKEEFFARIMGGERLQKIYDDPAMPSAKTVDEYLNGVDKEHWAFREEYQRAIEFRAHTIADECLDIVDDRQGLENTNQHGEPYPIPDRDHLRRIKLRLFTRHWLLERMLPETYGPPSVRRKARKSPTAERVQPIINVIDWKDLPPEIRDGEPERPLNPRDFDRSTTLRFPDD